MGLLKLFGKFLLIKTRSSYTYAYKLNLRVFPNGLKAQALI